MVETIMKANDKSVEFLKDWIERNPDIDDMGVRGLLYQYESKKRISLVEAIKSTYPRELICQLSRDSVLGGVILGYDIVTAKQMYKEAKEHYNLVANLPKEARLLIGERILRKNKYEFTHYAWKYLIICRRNKKSANINIFKMLMDVAENEDFISDIFVECIYFIQMFKPKFFTKTGSDEALKEIWESKNEDGSYGVEPNYIAHQTALTINILKNYLYYI